MGKLTKIVNMLSEGRVGFKMDEVMSGTHEFIPGHGPEGEYPMEFRGTWGPEHMSKWLNPWGEEFMTQPMKGTISIGEFCEDVPCIGSLQLAYFSEQKVKYELMFSVEGEPHVYIGEKINIKPWNLHKSHTTCYGGVFEIESGEMVSRSVTYFRFKTAPAFLASFRLE
jgi:hypothetical protein